MFTASRYIKSSFKELKLASEEICGVEFEACDFSGCDFSYAIFKECRFVSCRFKNCNMALASFKGASFSDVLFEGCKLLGINWSEAKWPQYQMLSPVKFRAGCNLTDSSFFGLFLEELEISDCKVQSADFREASLVNATLVNNDFSRSLFGKTNLQKANFSGSDNYSISVLNNQIKGAKFSKGAVLGLLDGLNIDVVD